MEVAVQLNHLKKIFLSFLKSFVIKDFHENNWNEKIRHITNQEWIKNFIMSRLSSSYFGTRYQLHWYVIQDKIKFSVSNLLICIRLFELKSMDWSEAKEVAVLDISQRDTTKSKAK